MEHKIQLKHPQGKKAVSISKDKYEMLKTEIVKYLSENSSGTFSEMARAIAGYFNKKKIKFDGSLNWYLEWVKLDLEANKVIEKLPGTSPQQYRLCGKRQKKVAEIKTKQTTASVEKFINSIGDEQKRKDSFTILGLMKKASGEEPKMWGASMIGFGLKRYKSPRTGREVDWFHIGFSPRKTNLSLHLVLDLKAHTDSLKKLGKHKTGVGCVYVNKLDDIDLKVLEKLIRASVKGK